MLQGAQANQDIPSTAMKLTKVQILMDKEWNTPNPSSYRIIALARNFLAPYIALVSVFTAQMALMAFIFPLSLCLPEHVT